MLLRTDIFSRLMGAPTIAFADREANAFRIMRVPALRAHDTPSPKQGSAGKESSFYKAKALPKKPKIPRPPNAFILYRKEYHPILKAANPSYHNNDISVILGKQWKDEPEDVKHRYRVMAEQIKEKHKVDHPQYQYAPRKPSEKKRRMTARKIAAALEQNEAVHTLTMEEAGDDGVSGSATPDVLDIEHEGFLATGRPAGPRIAYDRLGNLQTTIPTIGNEHELKRLLDSHTSQISPQSAQMFDHVNQFHINSAVPTYVQNDQDFADSLVDWEGIDADLKLLKDASSEELAQLTGIETGNDSLSLSNENERDLFQAELQRIMRFFK